MELGKSDRRAYDAVRGKGNDSERHLTVQLLHLIPMLSSISSFLPAALQISSDKDKSPLLTDEDKQLSDSPIAAKDDEDMAVDEHGVKKKKDRTNEVCLILLRQPTRFLYTIGMSARSCGYVVALCHLRSDGGRATTTVSRLLGGGNTSEFMAYIALPSSPSHQAVHAFSE